MKGLRSFLVVTVWIAGFLVASQAMALPPCETYCSCNVPCFVTACDGGGGFVQDCSEWGICATSCYCGGECLKAADPLDFAGSETAAPKWSQPAGSCSEAAQADLLLWSIFS